MRRRRRPGRAEHPAERPGPSPANSTTLRLSSGPTAAPPPAPDRACDPSPGQAAGRRRPRSCRVRGPGGSNAQGLTCRRSAGPRGPRPLGGSPRRCSLPSPRLAVGHPAGQPQRAVCCSAPSSRSSAPGHRRVLAAAVPGRGRARRVHDVLDVRGRGGPPDRVRGGPGLSGLHRHRLGPGRVAGGAGRWPRRCAGRPAWPLLDWWSEPGRCPAPLLVIRTNPPLKERPCLARWSSTRARPCSAPCSASAVPGPIVALVGTGVCGTLTTFSTLGADVVRMLEERTFGRALGYLAATLVLGSLPRRRLSGDRSV